MDYNLINKIDDIINIFENSSEIKRLSILKKEIYQDKEIKNKIERFNFLKENQYSNELIQLKKDLLNNKNVKEYKKIENEILLLTFSINKKLSKLINKKGCYNENN